MLEMESGPGEILFGRDFIVYRTSPGEKNSDFWCNLDELCLTTVSRIKSSRGCVVSGILNWSLIMTAKISAFSAASKCMKPSLDLSGYTGVGLFKRRLLIL